MDDKEVCKGEDCVVQHRNAKCRGSYNRKNRILPGMTFTVPLPVPNATEPDILDEATDRLYAKLMPMLAGEACPSSESVAQATSAAITEVLDEMFPEVSETGDKE